MHGRSRMVTCLIQRRFPTAHDPSPIAYIAISLYISHRHGNRAQSCPTPSSSSSSSVVHKSESRNIPRTSSMDKCCSVDASVSSASASASQVGVTNVKICRCCLRLRPTAFLTPTTYLSIGWLRALDGLWIGLGWSLDRLSMDLGLRRNRAWVLGG